MKINNSLKIVAGTALVSSFAFSAQAAPEVKISGQINRAITYVDNGVDEDILFVDNNNSGTRFRLTGKMDVSPGLTAGVKWETQYQDNSSSAMDIGDKDNTSQFSSRVRELWFKGGLGKVTLGQGSGASDGTSEVDLSGTSIADGPLEILYAGVNFVDAAGNKIAKNGSAFDNFDGLSRYDRVRYDAPAFGPISVGVSGGQDKADLGVRYSQKLGGGSKIAAALGYAGNNAADFKQLGISASYLTAGGFNVTGAYGEKDNDVGVDPTNAYIKIGQKFGPSAVSLSYNKAEDMTAAGVDAERFNIAYVYHIAKGVEIYTDYSNASLDGALDQDLFAVGSRIKF